MQAELTGNPDFGHVAFSLDEGERVLIESGAMAAMDSDLEVGTQMMGGFVSALVRRVFAGESLMVGDYKATRGNSRLVVSPAIPGMVIHRQLSGGPAHYMQAGAFLACTPGVNISTVFGGLRAIFSGESIFFLKVAGSGELWLNAYGAIIERELDGDELVVAGGHVLGWEEGIDWHLEGMGSLFTTIFSGEGLVMRLKGKGKVWLQSRSVSRLVSWISGYCR